MTAKDAGGPSLAVYGAYSDSELYQRNRSLIEVLSGLAPLQTTIRAGAGGVAEHGLDVHSPAFAKLSHTLSALWELWRRRGELSASDLIYIPYPAYLPLLLLWLSGMRRGRRVIADAFLELHSTIVTDRQLVPDGSIRAKAIIAFQKAVLRRADVVLIDTPAQAALLSRLLDMAADRVFDVPVGINESIWQPCAPRAPVGPCRIVFWGTFIPLHGVGIILEAIRILQSRQLDLEVTLIGDGQQGASLAEELANNPIACLRWRRELVGSATLLDEAMGAHILLGVFGESDKAGAVVPYKVQQALACNRPVISRDGPALGGVADPELGLIAIPPADPVALADTIEATWERLKGGWAVRSREIYDAHFSRAIIESRLAAALHRAARLDP